MEIEGKVWGTTRPLIVNPIIEVHRITVKQDAYCSKHQHQSKINAFYVESGKLLIRRWKNDYDLVDETNLLQGQICIVPAGEVHQFKGITPTTFALEFYWSQLDAQDIIRANVGGVIEKTGLLESHW